MRKPTKKELLLVPAKVMGRKLDLVKLFNWMEEEHIRQFGCTESAQSEEFMNSQINGRLHPHA